MDEGRIGKKKERKKSVDTANNINATVIKVKSKHERTAKIYIQNDKCRKVE